MFHIERFIFAISHPPLWLDACNEPRYDALLCTSRNPSQPAHQYDGLNPVRLDNPDAADEPSLESSRFLCPASCTHTHAIVSPTHTHHAAVRGALYCLYCALGKGLTHL